MENSYLKDHYYLRSYDGPPPEKQLTPRKRTRSTTLAEKDPSKHQKLAEDFNSSEWLAFRDLLLSADITTGISESITLEEIQSRKQLATELSDPYNMIELIQKLETGIDTEGLENSSFDSLSFEEKVELLYAKSLGR